MHTLLWARAFVFATAGTDARLVVVVAELGMLFQSVHQEVLRRLPDVLGDRYGPHNVVLSATHTHSGPGGYSHHLLYNLTTFGFDRRNFEVIVDGIVSAIVDADADCSPAELRCTEGILAGASRNRSRRAYLRNPAEEIRRHGRDVDERVTQLEVRRDQRLVALINWFPVHGTSMSNRNRMISSDNKGLAAVWMERDHAPGAVAAFAQSHEGDASPHVHGWQQVESAERDLFDVEESAGKQLQAALGLLAGPGRPVTGPVQGCLAYVDFSRIAVNGVSTARPALGWSMPAGAEDGPGPPVFREGCSLEHVRGWRRWLAWLVRRRGQGAKPVFLWRIGRRRGLPWSPEVLPLQVARIGSLGMVAVPFELTTMAGRRLISTLEARLAPAGVERVVVTGLANAYAGYVTTPEEYAAQHYEGASTHFGPLTLPALISEVERLLPSLIQGVPADEGRPPPPVRWPLSLHLIRHFELPLPGFRAGRVRRQPRMGDGLVSAEFWSGHPDHSLHTGGDRLCVERELPDGSWQPAAADADPELRLRWRPWLRGLPGLSVISAEWQVPPGTSGSFRIVYRGEVRYLWRRRPRSFAITSDPIVLEPDP